MKALYYKVLMKISRWLESVRWKYATRKFKKRMSAINRQKGIRK